MVGKTHLCAGVCAGTAFALWADLPLAQAGIAAAAGLIGGVIPDLDHRKSKVTQKTGLLGFFSSHLLKHRGILHTPIIYIILSAILTLSFEDSPMIHAAIFGAFVGELSHLFLDMLNQSGIPLLWPITRKRISLLPIQTGGKMDRAIGVLALCLAAWFTVQILF